MTVVPIWEPAVRDGQGRWKVAGAECIDIHDLAVCVAPADSRTTAMLEAMGGPAELGDRLRELGHLDGDYSPNTGEPIDVWIGASGTTISGELGLSANRLTLVVRPIAPGDEDEGDKRFSLRFKTISLIDDPGSLQAMEFFDLRAKLRPAVMRSSAPLSGLRRTWRTRARGRPATR